MRVEVRRAILPVICFAAVIARAQNLDLSGKWQVSILHHGRTEYGQLTLKPDGERWTGEMFGNAFLVTLHGSEIEVRCQGKDPGKRIAVF